MRGIPEEVAKLPNLRVVNCRHNRIKNSGIPADLFGHDDLSVLVGLIILFIIINSYGLCKEIFFLKNPRLLWKWVGGSRCHSEIFLFLENHPKIPLKQVQIFLSSIPCVFCMYILYIVKSC